MENLGPKVEELLLSLQTKPVAGDLASIAFSNYFLWMLISSILLLVLFVAARRYEGLVPKGRLTNLVEAGVEFVRSDIAVEIIGRDGTKYFPFIGTMFFFILINNLVGLIPGAKPGTGTMGVTVALSTIVFIFFNAAGFKAQGFFGYLKSFSPPGVPFPINIVVWIIEVFSAILRVFTLAVRLFANMYAGHIVIGVFAILTELAVEPLLHQLSLANAAGALPGIAWLALLTGLMALELLVAFIQAYVFTLLTAVYIQQAVAHH